MRRRPRLVSSCNVNGTAALPRATEETAEERLAENPDDPWQCFAVIPVPVTLTESNGLPSGVRMQMQSSPHCSFA